MAHDKVALGAGWIIPLGARQAPLGGRPESPPGAAPAYEPRLDRRRWD